MKKRSGAIVWPTSGERRRAGRLVVATSLLAAIALLAISCGSLADTSDAEGTAAEGGGTANGNSASSDDADPTEDPDDTQPDDDAASTEPVVTTEVTEPAPIEMPDLIGLTEAEARSELGDLGLDEPAIQTQESFEAAGTVLEQVPSAGRVITGTISLVVADAVEPVPDFVGQPIAEVRRWAEPREIEIREELRLDTDARNGTVLEQLPVAGAAASQELVVTIAETPTILELGNLTPVGENCYRVEDLPINGTAYPSTPRLLVRSFSSCSGSRSAQVSFDLSRDWSSLRFTTGLHDRMSSNAVVQLEILGDGTSLLSETVVFGESRDFGWTSRMCCASSSLRTCCPGTRPRSGWRTHNSSVARPATADDRAARPSGVRARSVGPSRRRGQRRCVTRARKSASGGVRWRSRSSSPM